MTKRQKYYLLQKLCGLFFILMGVVAYQLDGDATMMCFGIPAGFGFIFTKKELLINKLYFEMKEEEENRRS